MTHLRTTFLLNTVLFLLLASHTNSTRCFTYEQMGAIEKNIFHSFKLMSYGFGIAGASTLAYCALLGSQDEENIVEKLTSELNTRTDQKRVTLVAQQQLLAQKLEEANVYPLDNYLPVMKQIEQVAKELQALEKSYAFEYERIPSRARSLKDRYAIGTAVGGYLLLNSFLFRFMHHIVTHF